MMRLRLHNMVLHTRVLGPGIRCAIWFQGCTRRCKGCMSPETRDFDGGVAFDVNDICKEILKLKDIEGITISGGEPFLQIDSLHSLLQKIRTNSNLGVIIYTGYRIEELQAMRNEKVDDILSQLSDLIIDGEYIEGQNDGRSLIGSANQKLYFVTDRYRSSENEYQNKKRNVEIIAAKNDMLLIGVPDKRTLQKWHELVNGMNDKT